MTAVFELAHAPPFTGRFVRSVVRLVTSDSAWVWVGRSPASSVSHAGSADTDAGPGLTQELPGGRGLARQARPGWRPIRRDQVAQDRRGSHVSGCVAERRLWLAVPAAATVTFTRSLPASSATVSVTFAPSIRFNARRVPIAVPAFWIVNGSEPETISPATWVCAGRSPATKRRASGDAPLLVHRDLRVGARRDSGAGETDHSGRDRQPADRVDLDDALVGGRGVRIRERAERLARREVDHGVHRDVVAGVQRHPQVARVVGLAPLDRAQVGQAHEAGAGDVAGAELPRRPGTSSRR